MKINFALLNLCSIAMFLLSSCSKEQANEDMGIPPTIQPQVISGYIVSETIHGEVVFVGQPVFGWAQPFVTSLSSDLDGSGSQDAIVTVETSFGAVSAYSNIGSTSCINLQCAWAMDQTPEQVQVIPAQIIQRKTIQWSNGYVETIITPHNVYWLQ